MNEEKYRIRKKGDKHMIEKVENGHWIGRTLYPEKVWNWLVSSEKRDIVSESQREEKEKVPQKFAHHVLCELDKSDTSDLIPDKEALKKLWEITKE